MYRVLQICNIYYQLSFCHLIHPFWSVTGGGDFLVIHAWKQLAANFLQFDILHACILKIIEILPISLFFCKYSAIFRKYSSKCQKLWPSLKLVHELSKTHSTMYHVCWKQTKWFWNIFFASSFYIFIFSAIFEISNCGFFFEK